MVQHHETDAELQSKKLGGLRPAPPTDAVVLVHVPEFDNLAQWRSRIPKLCPNDVWAFGLDDRKRKKSRTISISPRRSHLEGHGTSLECLPSAGGPALRRDPPVIKKAGRARHRRL